MDCDDGGVGCVSGAAQPERIVNANPTAGFARRLSNVLARSSQFRGVQHRIQQDVAPGAQVLGSSISRHARRSRPPGARGMKGSGDGSVEKRHVPGGD
jgi:hypothetical protein